MICRVLIIATLFAPLGAFGQAPNSEQSRPQKSKRPSQKEMRAQMKTESRAAATKVQARLAEHIKTASDKSANREARREALENLARSQDIRAAKPLLDISDDADKKISHAALTSLWSLSKSLSDDPTQLSEVKKVIGARVREIAKEDPSVDLDRASAAVALLNNLGDHEEAVQLAKKVSAKGRFSVVREFVYWDESVEPSVFRMKPGAKQLFVDSMTKDRPEAVRVEAAALLAKSGNKEDSFATLVDIMMNGVDLGQRQKAMDELRSIGDQPSREAVQKAVAIPELAKSAKHLLMFWDKRPK